MRTLRARVGAGGIGLALLVGASLVVFASAMLELRDALATEHAALQQVAAGDDLRELVLDAEESSRIYVYTHEEQYLESWRRARARLGGRIAILLERTSGEPGDLRAAQAIARQARGLVDGYTVRLVRLARSDRPAGARELVATGKGNMTLNELRAALRDFQARQQLAVRQLEDEADDATARAIARGGAALAASALLILLFAAYFSFRVAVPVRRVGEAARRLAGGDLAAHVEPSGSGEIAELARDFNAMAGALAAGRDELARADSIKNTMLDATLEAITLLDLEGVPVLRNARMDEFWARLDVPPDAALAERLAALGRATTDPDGYRRTTEEILANPERVAIDEFQLAASQRCYLRYAAPVRDASGRVTGRIITLRDVTDERTGQRQTTQLLATVSHELRTPLAAVVGFAELLAEHTVDEETRVRYVETIRAEAARLTALVDDLLDVQRIQEGRLQLERERFDLLALVRERSAEYAGWSPRHSIELSVPERSADVEADRERIAQVLDKLVSNAIRYSPQGGRVLLLAERADGRARISVVDEGIGLAPDARQRVFSSFFRVDAGDTSEFGGAGLGLALAREIVEQLGGRMGFDSEAGRGSRVWFELPLSA